MPIFTRYKLSGEVTESWFIDLNEITQRKYSILGQKARITTKDGKVCEGFKTGHLRNSDLATILVPIDTVAKIEVILFSDPHWGTPPFNEFLFSSEIKQKINDYKKVSQKRLINFDCNYYSCLRFFDII